MGDPAGFLKVRRIEGGYRPVEERVQDYSEVAKQLPVGEQRLQASRCMDCGVPFCQWACPVANRMPEWQDALYRDNWEAAYDILQATNNFPEFTGRICPAPCEMACVLSINGAAVTIRENELAVIEHAFRAGYVRPHPPEARTGRLVAVVGSGPAGLACADLLNKRGHTVVLYESDDAVGGYLRFGVPDFKLDKSVIDRRVDLLVEEGLIVKTGIRVGEDIPAQDLLDEYDAVCLAIGARQARDLPVEGRDLEGIHFAVDYLTQQNRIACGDHIPDQDLIVALGKQVVVIGGGDTGADCVGTANRQGAKSVTQLEIEPRPPESRPPGQPWPLWPKLYKTSSSHEEGCERLFSVSTDKFVGEDGRVKKLLVTNVNWQRGGNGRYRMEAVPDSSFTLDADLVILAMGFEHVVQKGLVEDLGLALDDSGNIAIDEDHMTSHEGVFAAGDAHQGPSLVAWAISEGREAARGVDAYLGATRNAEELHPHVNSAHATR